MRARVYMFISFLKRKTKKERFIFTTDICKQQLRLYKIADTPGIVQMHLSKNNPTNHLKTGRYLLLTGCRYANTYIAY